jgi:hypothetical protein
MTRAVLLPLDVRKEIRALLPVWLVCAGAIVAAAVLQGIGGHRARTFAAWPIFAYVLGSIALGALSMGHEYTGRTLTLLLSLPADRRRLYLVKLGVLFPMLLTLAVLAYELVFTPLAFDRDFVNRMTVPFFSIMSGLFLAPWLTMICRSPLAGVVFAIAIPGLIYIAGDIAAFAAYGFSPDAARLQLALFWWGLTGVCAVAAVSSWRMFMRLEAIEGDDSQVRLPRWLRDRTAAAAAPDVEPARQRHPVWLLAMKELRLQQLTFVVSGIYLLEWAALSVVRQIAPEFEGIPFAVLTGFHSGAAALLSGSLASAEERQFGTLESQVLLPMAAWKQWTVKAGMTLGVALVLAVGLPALLGSLSPSGDNLRVNAWFAGTMVLLTAGSLYVSSLCASGLRAMLTSISVIVGAALVMPFAFEFVHRLVLSSVDSALTAAQRDALRSWAEPLAIALAAGFLPLVLWLGLVNHRSAERSLARVWPQAACIGAWVMLGFAILVL